MDLSGVLFVRLGFPQKRAWGAAAPALPASLGGTRGENYQYKIKLSIIIMSPAVAHGHELLLK